MSSSIGLSLAALGSEVSTPQECVKQESDTPQTDGSILSPSNVNNCVGIKPTVGLVSRYLVIPISEHQDTVGPIARSVKDAAYLLQAIAGPDTNDNYTSAIPSVPDYVAACNYSSLRGARIGIPYNVLALYSSSARYAPVFTAFYAAVELLEQAGATIVSSNFTQLTAYENSGNETIVLETDFINNLATYLSELTYNPNNIHNLADLVNFTMGFAQEDYPDRNVNTWLSALALGYNNTSPQAYAARQADAMLGGPGGLLGAISTYNLSAVLLPTSFAPGFAAIVGAPVVTVPLGFYPETTAVVMNSRGTLASQAPGIPFGLAFLGGKFTESTLIGLAYAYEQRTHNRNKHQPYIKPNFEIADVITNSLGISL